jgi:hypothetical protein
VVIAIIVPVKLPLDSNVNAVINAVGSFGFFLWLRSETEKGGPQPAQLTLLGHFDIAAAAFLSLSVRGALGVVIAASALSVAADDGLIPIARTACAIAA